MDVHLLAGAPAPDNVIDFGAYRRARGISSCRSHALAKIEEWHARVYIDLDASGRLSYGMSRADRDNALYLLRPALYLADQLLKIAMEE